MYEKLFKSFDAWEALYKARKAKGLSKWDSLSHIADKLSGKHAKHITFTSSHPRRGGKKNLGSVEGNSHFLMGYGNPGFHLAPYHWQIIYPELTEEEAEDMHAKHGHPSKPELWERSGKAVKAEGDVDEGQPHPWATSHMAAQAAEAKRMKAKSPYGEYTVDVNQGLVYGKHNDHVYKWELIKDSFFAADNPEVAEAIENAHPLKKAHTLPDVIRHMCQKSEFSEEVWPLVKSLFPEPGSVVIMGLDSENVYGVINDTAIEFYDEAGHAVSVPVYDQDCSDLSLVKGGNTHPSTLYNFAVNYLGIDGEHFVSFVKSEAPPVEDSLPRVVEGSPSKGYDDFPSHYDEKVKKSVVIGDDNTFRVVLEAD